MKVRNNQSQTGQRRYIFLSGPISTWIKVYIFVTLFLITAFYAFDLPIWLAPVGTTIVLQVLLFVNLGIVTLLDHSDDSVINIQSRTRRIKLTRPLISDGWWHYIHHGKSIANDVRAVLHVTDSKGNEVYFSETILLELRHPNDLPFREVEIPEGCTEIEVQRVDKLARFLGLASFTQEIK